MASFEQLLQPLREMMSEKYHGKALFVIGAKANSRGSKGIRFERRLLPDNTQ
jgi:hypothetical protein